MLKPHDIKCQKEVNISDANIRVPKSVLCKDVTLPNEWLLENENHPRKIQNDVTNLDFIQQYLDGAIRISFD